VPLLCPLVLLVPLRCLEALLSWPTCKYKTWLMTVTELEVHRINVDVGVAMSDS
jgi:hypothetical protein